MLVKCWIAGAIESNLSTKNLIALTRMYGKDSLEGLTSNDSIVDPNNIHINNDQALVLVGGRQSIIQFLQAAGDTPMIKGGPPMMVGVMRLHHMYSKNETCVKVIANRRNPPNDGIEYENVGRYIPSAVVAGAGGTGIAVQGTVAVSPQALAGALQRIFG